jgi:CHC2 zinc finger
MPKEYPRFANLPPELLQAYASTFIHRWDCYPIQLDKGSYVTLKKPLTIEIIKAHLKGLVTLGAYALNAESIAHWLCLDADEEESWQALQRVARSLVQVGIMPYLEPSRRGGHIWLFTPPMPGRIVREFGKGLVHHYDLSKLEIYPKQNMLTTGVGSLVRVPLGVHRKSGKRYHFIQLNGEPLAPTIREQIAVLTQPSLVPHAFIETMCAEVPQPTPLAPQQPALQKTKVDQQVPLSERLKNAISVYDFVSRYVRLDENDKGLCPFHDDQMESFQVNSTGNYWSCYAGCGGGSIIDFWAKWREKQGQDASFTATIKDLAQILFP